MEFMQGFLLVFGPLVMFITILIVAATRKSQNGSEDQWSEEEEDEFDDDEVAYWISEGWDGQGPPPGPF